LYIPRKDGTYNENPEDLFDKNIFNLGKFLSVVKLAMALKITEFSIQPEKYNSENPSSGITRQKRTFILEPSKLLLYFSSSLILLTLKYKFLSSWGLLAGAWIKN
jgi:hypothetical protein